MSGPPLIDRLFDRFYAKERGYGGGTARFHDLLAAKIPPGASILEIGAGSANPTTEQLARIGRVTAVDISEEVLDNHFADSTSQFDGGRLPFAEGEFDSCVSNYVLEHVENPDVHFQEVARVLRPGGVYVVRTPNLLHYVASASRLLPHFAHVKLANRMRALPEGSHEPWPTVYRANRPARLRRLAADAGLTTETCITIECEPSYAKGSVLLFFPMMVYERFVNMTEALAPFRASINAVFRKP